MHSFTAALATLKESCNEYEVILQKTLEHNSKLKKTVDKMGKALLDMKRIFNVEEKCGICFAKKQAVAFECGHVTCNDCGARSLRAERCPYCRRPVKELMKIFL